jgi:hypothetical protein
MSTIGRDDGSWELIPGREGDGGDGWDRHPLAGVIEEVGRQLTGVEGHDSGTPPE